MGGEKQIGILKWNDHWINEEKSRENDGALLVGMMGLKPPVEFNWYTLNLILIAGIYRFPFQASGLIVQVGKPIRPGFFGGRF